jgi:GT2 family glycosyltransferase
MPRGYEGHGYRALVAQNLSAVTGACLMVRRRVFDEVDGLDEDLPVSFNDIDFCLRVRAHGYRNAWTPFAELYHHESASRGREDTPEKLSRYAAEVAFMQKRWGEALLEDPAYNPNLSLQSHNCQLAFPPRCTRDG